MRFITEFEVPETFHGDPEYAPRHADRFVYNNKERLAYDMGILLQESFGWQNPVNNNNLHHRLEIEAFPMDKWIEFKKRFADALPDYDTVARVRLINALAALEEFHCKPSGDAITNQQLNK